MRLGYAVPCPQEEEAVGDSPPGLAKEARAEMPVSGRGTGGGGLFSRPASPEGASPASPGARGQRVFPGAGTFPC